MMGAAGLLAALFYFFKLAVSDAILRAEKSQSQHDQALNRRANESLEKKEKTQDARAGEHIDPNDPWRGV